MSIRVSNIFKNKKTFCFIFIFFIIYLILSTLKIPVILITSLLLTYYICFQSSMSLPIVNKLLSML